MPQVGGDIAKMKALSLTQPSAMLVTIGSKPSRHAVGRRRTATSRFHAAKEFRGGRARCAWGEPFKFTLQRAAQCAIRVGTNVLYALFWELGHMSIFTLRYERLEKWRPALLEHRCNIARKYFGGPHGHDEVRLIYPVPAREYDSVAYLDPRSTKVDGHHGEAIDAWLRDMCPDTWHRPPTEHRIAQKKGIIGPGEIEVPRGTGIRLQSIRYLDIECRQTTLVGTGDMPAVLDIDGSSFGRMYGSLTIMGRRPDGGGRMEVPRDVVQVHKSSQVHSTPQQTHFELEATIDGVWREWAFRGGSRDWNEVQEDHGRGKLLIFGFQGFDVRTDDTNDLCQGGVLCGFPNWSNNRRWWFDFLSIVSVGTAVGCNRSAVDVAYLTADGCRDVLWFAGAQNKMTIHAGEAELCSRFLVDAMHSGHDQTVHVSDFYAKLDQWRPDLRPPLGWSQGVWDRYPNAIGAWATAGKCLLDNVSFANLPVRRSKTNGKLYYATMLPRTPETPAGVENYDLTSIPAPRFYSCRPFASIKTRDCSAWGYTAGQGYNEFFAKGPEGAGEIRHEDWKNCREGDGVILTHVTQAINQQ